MKKLFTLLCLCVLCIGNAWAGTTYKLQNVTSVSAGSKYVFVQDDHAMGSSVSSSALQTVSDYSTKSLNGNETYVWELEAAEEGYYLKNANLTSNQYLNNASSTTVSFGEKNSIWTIEFTNDVALISNKSNSNRFLGYTNATSYAYKAYATSNLDTYSHAITVYKLVEEVAGAVATPEFSVVSGIYNAVQSVELSCDTEGATIYYTTDGTEPNESSTQYSGAITVNKSKTIKAIAVKGEDESNIASATYKITIYASLAELVADGAPVSDGYTVTVTLTNEKIIGFYTKSAGDKNGIKLISGSQEVEIYTNDVANKTDWVIGGTVSGTLTCTWKLFNSTWELCPDDLNDLTYNAPLTYDITWMANGVEFTTTKVIEGDAVELPTTNPEKVGDMVFVGWTTEDYFDAEKAPKYVDNKTVPTSKATYYAVYAKETVGETTSVTKDIIAESDLSGSLTLNADVNPYQIGDLPITLTGAKGTSNFPAINVNSTSGTDLRFYKGTTCAVTFAATNGKPITKIEFMKDKTTASNLGDSFSANVGTLSGNIWTGSATSVTFTYNNGGTFKEQMYIINVTYSEGSPSVYSNYCTTITSANTTISSAGWATVCLPFRATITSENATAYYVTGTNGSALTKVKANVIPAGEGVLLKSNNGGAATVTFTASAEAADDATDNMMVGALTKTTFSEADTKYYILANDETKGLGFYYQGETGDGTSVECEAGKAVLAVPASAGAKAFFSLFDDATGIDAIHNSQCIMQNSQYNLNGMRVNDNYKGIVIINGKKVIK